MSDLNQTPSSARLQIAIFGRRNVGKSSLINALANQPVALVSEVSGTTTDPVAKAMELLPLGPVVLIDTAGIDDQGSLGELRIKRTYEVLNRTDLALLVIDVPTGPTAFDRQLLQLIRKKKLPVVGVLNQIDRAAYQPEKLQEWQEELQLELVPVSAQNGVGIEALKMALIRQAPLDPTAGVLIGDLVKPGAVVVLVIPIDSAAPKGRLILPQQQVLRDLLDHHCLALVTKESELAAALAALDQPPDLVITDSQAFAQVAAVVPADLPLTSFSIILARRQGDLAELVQGVAALKELHPGDRVLIAEGCTHHRQKDDIGTVKLPQWLQQLAGGALELQWSSGLGLPADLSQFKLIVHCGGCMLNRREMLYRISLAQQAKVPIVNYGVLIAYANGILPRALQPFAELRPLAPFLFNGSQPS